MSVGEPHAGAVSASGPSRQQLARVAEGLDARLPEIVREMRDLLVGSIGELDVDPQMVEMLQASIEGNVATICHILANDIAIENLQPTTAAVEYAMRLAQRDVSVSALTRAYYLGQSMFLRLGIDAVEQLETREDERIELVRAVADIVHRYIDWILQYVSVVHEAERRRWWNAKATMNATAIRKVLRGDDHAAAAAFEADTGYPLGTRHLAVIAWVDEAESAADQQRIEQLLRRVAAAVGAGSTPLITATDPQTAWAWFGAPSRADWRDAIDRLLATTPGIRLTAGSVAPGADGFRRSHEQAARARVVAMSSAPHRAQQLVAYRDADVSLLSMFTGDLPSLRRWIADVLGDAAQPGERAATLRETLGVFYATGRNAMRTAELLGVHRNTVRQRVARFEESMGGVADPLELGLALRLHASFGADGSATAR